MSGLRKNIALSYEWLEKEYCIESGVA